MEINAQYDWVKDTEKKYGKEATQRLVNEQRKYESKKQDNDCKYCGRFNTGSIVYIESLQRPMLIHYGLFNSSGKCDFCRRQN